MRIIFLTLAICLITVQAQACICTMKDGERLEQINNAKFIGVYKVLGSKEATYELDGIIPFSNPPTNIQHGTEYHVSALATYKGGISSIESVYVSHYNDCNPTKMETGQMYRGIIVTGNRGVNFFPSSCLNVTQDEWNTFEKNKNDNAEWASFQSECKDSGKLIRVSGNKMLCSKKADDQGKVCKDGSECEGFCAVPNAEYEYFAQDLMASLDGETPRRRSIGKCSEWVDSPDGVVVEHGYTKR